MGRNKKTTAEFKKEFKKAFPRGGVVLKQYGEQYVVYEDFEFYWEEKDLTVITKKGMQTDNATIFELLPDAVIDDTGPISNGAVPHDRNYKLFQAWQYIPFRCLYDFAQGRYWTRKETDQMFWAANIKAGVPKKDRIITWFVRWNVFAAVRWMPKEEWDRKVIAFKSGVLVE